MVASERLKEKNYSLYYALLDYKDRNMVVVQMICNGEQRGLNQMTHEQIKKLLNKMVEDATR